MTLRTGPTTGVYSTARLQVALDRIAQLEAALRQIRDFEPVTNGDYAVMHAMPEMRRIAIAALATSETSAQRGTVDDR